MWKAPLFKDIPLYSRDLQFVYPCSCYYVCDVCMCVLLRMLAKLFMGVLGRSPNSRWNVSRTTLAYRRETLAFFGGPRQGFRTQVGCGMWSDGNERAERMKLWCTGSYCMSGQIQDSLVSGPGTQRDNDCLCAPDALALEANKLQDVLAVWSWSLFPWFE